MIIVVQFKRLAQFKTSLSSTWMPTKLLLWKFTFKLEAISKHHRIVFKVMESFTSFLKKNMVSSENWRRGIFKFLFSTWTPWKQILCLCLSNQPAKSSCHHQEEKRHPGVTLSKIFLRKNFLCWTSIYKNKYRWWL